MSTSTSELWDTPQAHQIAEQIASMGNLYCGPAVVVWVAAVWNMHVGRRYDYVARLRNKDLFPDGPRRFFGKNPGFQDSLNDILQRETNGDLKLSDSTHYKYGAIHDELEKHDTPVVIRMFLSDVRDGLHYTALFKSEKQNHRLAFDEIKFHWMDNGYYSGADGVHATDWRKVGESVFAAGAKHIVVDAHICFVSFGAKSPWTRVATFGVPLDQLAIYDFDGDGKADFFWADGRNWHVAESSNGYSWKKYADSQFKLAELAFGDFDGDGKCDVFRANGNEWFVAESSNGYNWRRLGTSAFRVDQLAFGDFDGDGKCDVFRANGIEWFVAESSNGYNWRRLGTSTFQVDQLAFGDFDGDGKCDVFRANGTEWFVAESSNGYNWRRLGTSTFRVDQLAFGDFDGDGKCDVFRANGNEWFVAESSNGYNWKKYADSKFKLAELAFGDFDGDGRMDVLRLTGGFRP